MLRGYDDWKTQESPLPEHEDYCPYCREPIEAGEDFERTDDAVYHVECYLQIESEIEAERAWDMYEAAR